MILRLLLRRRLLLALLLLLLDQGQRLLRLLPLRLRLYSMWPIHRT